MPDSATVAAAPAVVAIDHLRLVADLLERLNEDSPLPAVYVTASEGQVTVAITDRSGSGEVSEPLRRVAVDRVLAAVDGRPATDNKGFYVSSGRLGALELRVYTVIETAEATA